MTLVAGVNEIDKISCSNCAGVRLLYKIFLVEDETPCDPTISNVLVLLDVPGKHQGWFSFSANPF